MSRADMWSAWEHHQHVLVIILLGTRRLNQSSTHQEKDDVPRPSHPLAGCTLTLPHESPRGHLCESRLPLTCPGSSDSRTLQSWWHLCCNAQILHGMTAGVQYVREHP